MLKLINDFLNKTTMYKVLLYGLIVIVSYSFFLAILRIMPFAALMFFLSLVVLVLSSYVSNKIISTLLDVSTNIESALITGLILFLIIQPASHWMDLLALLLIALFATASKYLLVINNIHIFNPSAFGALLGGLLLSYYATWWVGSTAMFPIVLIVGVLIIKKIRRFEMAGIFILSALISAFAFNFGPNMNFMEFLYTLFASWPVIFFASVMLVEPLTMPGTRKLQLLYALFIGALFGARFNIGPLYSTPELALVSGNLVFFAIQPRSKFILHLKEKLKLSPDIFEFAFKSDRKINFKPGQFLEWTLPHANADSRGNRRFFTVASSPSESEVKIGVRVSTPGSSFKHSLQQIKVSNRIYAAQISGDFILDHSKPAVFIAGGIGVTPFRSTIKYLLDTGQKHDITMFYFTKKAEDFVYKDIFDKAAQSVGLKIHYIISSGNTDLEKLIKDNIDNYSSSKYYLSGPSAMVDSYKKVIKKLGVNKSDIVTDYFPGY